MSDARALVLSDAMLADVPHAGSGKAAVLARISAASVAVPRFVYVTPEAFREHHDQSPHDGHHESTEPVDWATAAAAQQGRPLHTSLRSAIISAYRTLPGHGRIAPLVAVRSSAVGEDSASASHAGQFDSFLGVQGDEAVLAAVQRCWASAGNERSDVYRSQLQLTATDPLMGVIIQQQVVAEKAGVLFTQHPTSGDRSVVYIEANFGTGESVVGGLVTPDTAIVARTSPRVVSCEIASKSIMTRVSTNGGGSQTVDVPRILADARVLTDAQAMELAEVGSRIEELLGGPQDIEWAIDSTQLWILQARPITSRAINLVRAAGSEE